MRRTLLLAVLALGFAPAPFLKRAERDPGAADLKALQGEWVEAKKRLGGAELPPGGSDVYSSDQLDCWSSGRITARWHVFLDAAAVPKRMILRSRESATVLGCLYRLEGDTLTICFASSAAPPESFKQEADMFSITYRRKKP